MSRRPLFIWRRDRLSMVYVLLDLFARAGSQLCIYICVYFPFGSNISFILIADLSDIFRYVVLYEIFNTTRYRERIVQNIRLIPMTFVPFEFRTRCTQNRKIKLTRLRGRKPIRLAHVKVFYFFYFANRNVTMTV